MTIFSIEIRAKAARHDVRARQLVRDILHIPLESLPSLLAVPAIATASSGLSSSRKLPSFAIRTANLYRITAAATFTTSQLDQLISHLLIDPVVQEAHVNGSPG